MKKLILTAFIASAGLVANAQKVNEEISDKHHYFFFANPLYWECSAAEVLRLGVDVRAIVNPTKNIWADFLFQKAYVEGTVKGNYKDSGVQNKYSSFQNVELGVRFAFSDNVSIGGLHIITGGRRVDATHEIIESVNAGIPKRKIYTIGGGLYGYHQMAKTSWGLIKSNDNTYVHTTQGINIGGNDPLFASMQQQGIYGRFSIITIANTDYSFRIAGQQGKRNFVSRYLKDMSFDVMLPLSTSLDNFIINGNPYTVELGKDDTFKMRNVGFKLAISHLTFYEKIGLSTGIDVGVRPGIKQGGFFFGSKIGVSFTQ